MKYRTLALLVFFRALALPAATRPNIVLIMVDDMGYSDIGCYGGEIETSNLDRLADAGLRSTQFCNTSRCGPTRASLLTGLYQHQTGVGHMTTEGSTDFDYGADGYRGQLNRNCVTLAEMLGSSGYNTYMPGKWKAIARDGVYDWERYDIEADRNELNNVANEKPEVVARLDRVWKRWALRAKAAPKGNPEGKGYNAKK